MHDAIIVVELVMVMGITLGTEKLIRWISYGNGRHHTSLKGENQSENESELQHTCYGCDKLTLKWCSQTTHLLFRFTAQHSSRALIGLNHASIPPSAYTNQTILAYSKTTQQAYSKTTQTVCNRTSAILSALYLKALYYLLYISESSNMYSEQEHSWTR